MWLPLIIIIAALLILALSKKISSYRKSRIEKAPEVEVKKETKKEKREFRWGWIVVIVILAIAGYSGYRYFTGLPSNQQAPAVAQQLPICAGGEYDFSNVELPNEVEVNFHPDCICKITLPPRAVYRTDLGQNAEIVFIDGSRYISGPKSSNWYGLKRGVFKVRGLSGAGIMKITLERKS